VNRTPAETPANRPAPEPAAKRPAPEVPVNKPAPEQNGNRRPEQAERSNNRPNDKNRNKNKKGARPEPPPEEVVQFAEDEGINNPDLVTINMICSNMALLQTILDVQVKILAKVNNQDVGQVNAMVDGIYRKYRKKAMNDLMDFDKDA
jgi:hypothetical protein